MSSSLLGAGSMGHTVRKPEYVCGHAEGYYHMKDIELCPKRVRKQCILYSLPSAFPMTYSNNIQNFFVPVTPKIVVKSMYLLLSAHFFS